MPNRHLRDQHTSAISGVSVGHVVAALAAAAFVAVALAFSGSAVAHHSAAQFDFEQRVAITGIVREIDVRNPHVKLVLEMTSDAGETKQIEYEGDGRNNLFRRGWRTTDISVGDEVTVGVAPLRDGSDDGGYVRSFTLANGKQF